MKARPVPCEAERVVASGLLIRYDPRTRRICKALALSDGTHLQRVEALPVDHEAEAPHEEGAARVDGGARGPAQLLRDGHLPHVHIPGQDCKDLRYLWLTPPASRFYRNAGIEHRFL